MDNNTREAGMIDSVFYGVEDHGILTASVRIAFAGSSQGFGQLALDAESGPAFIRELCDTFGVCDAERLKGLGCFALRCFPGFNTEIEGLESPSGRRFTLTGFVRKHWPEKAKSPLDRKRDSILSTIAWAERRVKEERQALAILARDYVDWEA